MVGQSTRAAITAADGSSSRYGATRWRLMKIAPRWPMVSGARPEGGPAGEPTLPGRPGTVLTIRRLPRELALGASVKDGLQLGVGRGHRGGERRAVHQRLQHVRDDEVLAGVGRGPVLGVQRRHLAVRRGGGE